MLKRRLITFLGRWSDRVTIANVFRSAPWDASISSLEENMGLIRRQQIDSVSSLTTFMMVANIVNVIALMAFVSRFGDATYLSFVWAALVVVYALAAILRLAARRKRAEQECASVRATGATVLHSALLGALWSFPAIYWLPMVGATQTGFICALAAGMVAGGYVALSPIPLAAYCFVTFLLMPSVVALFFNSTEAVNYLIIVIMMFCIIMYRSISKSSPRISFKSDHFTSNIVGNSQVNRFIYGTQDYVPIVFWTTKNGFDFERNRSGLQKFFEVPEHKVKPRNLIQLAENAGARPLDEQSDAVWSALRAGRGGDLDRFDLMLALDDADGRTRYINLIAQSKHAPNSTGQSGFIGFVQDKTLEVENLAKIKYLATHDAETGLLNYSEFSNLSENYKNSCIENEIDETYVLCYIDADNLKSTNDSFGHAVGNEFIKSMAGKIMEFSANDGLACRKSGDEFIILFRDISAELAMRRISLLHKELCSDFEFENRSFSMKSSMGVSIGNRSDFSAKDMEIEADRALYVAKRSGKGRVEIYDSALGATLAQEAQLAEDISSALSQDEISVVFQPIVDIDSQRIVGCEALLRWRHAKYGDISPPKVVEIARKKGLGSALRRSILSQSLIQAAHWSDDVFVSVNLTASELEDPGFFNGLEQDLLALDFLPERLHLEITEAELLSRTTSVLTNLSRLRGTGISISIDDFGAGYSSLGSLPDYPSDCLKIDRSLVMSCDQSTPRRAILAAVATMAKTMGLSIVAEGIETRAELEVVRGLGVRRAQGYLFHRPMASEDVLGLVSLASSERNAASHQELRAS